MFEVIRLDFDYHDKPLLNQINFSLKAGDLLHLRGVNGAGKTTLLRVLAGLFYPLAGEIRFQGESIHVDLGRYQQQLCYVSHKSGLNPMLTVRENLYFDLNAARGNPSIDEVLSASGLENCADQWVEHLSAGQRHRVSLLRLFMKPKTLWFLDEPFVALDHRSLEWLKEKIQEHRQQGGMVILTSHQPLPFDAGDYREYQL